MKKIVVWLTIIVASVLSQTNNEMNFSIKAEREGDFGFDSASLRIKSYDVNAPTCWQFQITRDKTVLFDTAACDSDVDKYFRDSLYVTGCLNYADCKNKWYKEDFKKQLVRPGNADYIKPVSEKIVKGYLSKGLSQTESRDRAKKAILLMRTGKISVFTPSWAPEGRNEFPKIYDEKIQKFIEVSNW